MRKIGLITCYADNYGACLQAYALQQAIIKTGNECEIIKYTPIKSLKEHDRVYKFVIPIIRLLKVIKNRKSIYIYQRIMRRKFLQFKKDYLIFGMKSYVDIELLYKSPPIYDVYITGSDQLWNPVIHGLTNNKAYFLDFAPEGKKRVAYAPSIGISKIPVNCINEMKILIEKIDEISVRESEGKRIINEISDKECPVVLDPTLLFGKVFWSKIMKEYNNKKPYIFCYIFSEQSYIEEFIEYTKKLTEYEVVIIPYTKAQTKKGYRMIYDAGPKEFIGLIKNANLVITDSFHATAFSINLNVPFYSLLRNTHNELNNMNSRIFSILKMFNLTDRLITNKKDYPKNIKCEMDYSVINKKLLQLRERDLNILKRMIQD